MRGAFPLGHEPRLPDSLVADAKAALHLEADSLPLIQSDLSRYPGFIDRETLRSLLTPYASEQGVVKSLVRLIPHVDDRFRTLEQNVEHLLKQLEEWWKDEANQQKNILAPGDLEELQRRLPYLLSPIPGLARQAKAERLSQATGLPLEKIEVICDLRPIFDAKHEVIEGMIPFTTLRIVCKGVDGLPVAIDAMLSAQDVDQLATASTDAKKKLQKLRGLLEEKKVPVPSIDATKQEKDNG
ncbi:MAG: hypothetical protein M3552_10110 [Planctomycetota bacterium]|nr:hypothetical protein [Planctomycetota bacterium]